jgi:hypothetical protein
MEHFDFVCHDTVTIESSKHLKVCIVYFTLIIHVCEWIGIYYICVSISYDSFFNEYLLNCLIYVISFWQNKNA